MTLTPIPEDHSEVNSRPNGRQDRPLAGSETVRSTVGVVGEQYAGSSTDLDNAKEQPSTTIGHAQINGIQAHDIQNSSKCRQSCNWKIILAVSVLVVTGAVLGIMLGSRSKSNPFRRPGRRVPLSPSSAPTGDDFFTTLQPTLDPQRAQEQIELLTLENLFLLTVGQDAAREGTPEYEASQWFQSDSLRIRVQSHGEERVIQRYLLVFLYYLWNGPEWVDVDQFRQDGEHECNWNGILCNSADQVVGIWLPQSNLQGSLPSALFQLTALRNLVLKENILVGTIPETWWNWTDLETLSLSDNQVSGTLSPAVWRMPSLSRLLCQNNSLAGDFPDISTDQATEIQRVNMGRNLFSGPLPTNLMNVVGLDSLFLNANSFTGSIPNFRDNGSLTQLQLQENELVGSIPSSVGSLQSLTQLILYGNSFTSTIPPQLFDLRNLTYLDVSENELNGTLANLENAASLGKMFFNNNSLTGLLPSALPSTSKEAWFHCNNFTGPIPFGFARGLGQLSDLRINNNMGLEGELSLGVCNITELEVDCRIVCDCCISCF